MMPAAYDILAPVYDAFQNVSDAPARAAFLKEQFLRHETLHGPSDPQGRNGKSLVLDLGCGTGKVTQQLQDEGFDLIGIDASAEMLIRAQTEAFQREEALRPLYLQQDIAAFELYGTVNFIYTSLDTFNHLSPEALDSCLDLCVNYLHPGGLLFFDLLSLSYMKEKMGGNIYYELDEDYALLWTNAFSEKENVNRAAVTLFTRAGDSDFYERSETEITEYWHAPERLAGRLKAAGLRVKLKEYDKEAAVPAAEGRIFIAAYKEKD